MRSPTKPSGLRCDIKLGAKEFGGTGREAGIYRDKPFLCRHLLFVSHFRLFGPSFPLLMALFNVSYDSSSLIFPHVYETFLSSLHGSPVSSSSFASELYTLLSSLKLITFFGSHLLEPGSQATRILFVFLVILVIPGFLVYWTTWLFFVAHSSPRNAVKSPPTIPYMIPIVGHALYFAFSPSRCFAWAR